MLVPWDITQAQAVKRRNWGKCGDGQGPSTWFKEDELPMPDLTYNVYCFWRRTAWNSVRRVRKSITHDTTDQTRRIYSHCCAKSAWTDCVPLATRRRFDTRLQKTADKLKEKKLYSTLCLLKNKSRHGRFLLPFGTEVEISTIEGISFEFRSFLSERRQPFGRAAAVFPTSILLFR